MANKEQLALLRRSVEDWNEWRKGHLLMTAMGRSSRKVDLSGANLSQLNLSKANLSGANLYKANLSGTNLFLAYLLNADLSEANLSEADLSRACISDVNLSGANLFRANLVRADLNRTKLSGAYLAEVNFSNVDLSRVSLFNVDLSAVDLSNVKLSRRNLSELNLSEIDFSGVDFSGENLSGINCSGMDFSGVNFFGTNLSGGNFIKVNFRHSFFGLSVCVATSFAYSDLTGACIQDWNVNTETSFEGVVCDYIFLKWDEENQKGIERRPSDPNRNFAPGDFERFIRQSLETVDLIFGEGIDWNAFLQSFQGLQLDSEVGELSIAGIKKNRDGSFIVQVDVPADADKAAIEKDFWSRYQPLLDAKDQQIKLLQGQLEFSQDQVNRERQNAANLITIVQTMADKQQGDTYHIKADNIGVAGSHTTAESGSVIAGQYNAAEKQNLQQAAAEIQTLLKQLETEYGSDTMSEKMTVATEVIKEIEQNQSLAQRVIAAFKAGGMSALDSYLDTPVASFVISAIQNWYETR